MLPKHKTAILITVAIGGSIGSAILFNKAQTKASMIKESKNNKEKALNIIKVYGPTILTGAATIASIVMLSKVQTNELKTMTDLYEITKLAGDKFANKAIELVGEKKVKAIHDEVSAEIIRETPVPENVVTTGYGEYLCYDKLCGRYFKSDINHIKTILNDCSRDMMSDQTIYLNELYNRLGLSSTEVGDLLGWHVDDGLIEPDFSSHLAENGTPCLVMGFRTEPRYLNYE